MKDDFVSVIIPVYKTDKEYLKKSVQSVLAQTYDKFECIIVDDGNVEKYSEMLDDYKSVDERIKVVHKTNGGLGSARNFGVQNSIGEYVFFLDSDDYISPYALQNGIDVANKTKADMVIGALLHIAPQEKIDFVKKEKKIIIIENNEDKCKYIDHFSGYRNTKYKLSIGHAGASACSKLVKRDIVINTPFENDKMWDEDNIWNIKCTSKCNRIAIVDNLWYAYVINPVSMVRGYAGDRTKEFQTRAKQEYKLLKDLWPNCKQGIYYSVWDGMLRYCRTDVFNKNNNKKIKEKYKNFCNAVNFKEFKETVKNIDFDIEKRKHYRIIKNTIRNLMKSKNKRIAFFLLWISNKIIRV